MKTRVGIVEDELLVADNIAEALTEMGYIALEPAISYMEALTMIANERPDVLLLDINLVGKKDGIELAEKIKEDYDIPFIFLTANSDPITVDRVKKLNPPAFLVKPFSKEALYSSIEICLHNYSLQRSKQTELVDKENFIVKDSVFVKQGQYFHKVKIDDILYLESDKNYIFVHTVDNKLWVRTSFQRFMELAGSKNLMRIHKGYVVNVNKVTVINTDKIYIDKVDIPIGKSYRDDLLSHLMTT